MQESCRILKVTTLAILALVVDDLQLYPSRIFLSRLKLDHARYLLVYGHYTANFAFFNRFEEAPREINKRGYFRGKV